MVRKLIFLALVKFDMVVNPDRNGTADRWANFLCYANEHLWPEYDGESLADLFR